MAKRPDAAPSSSPRPHHGFTPRIVVVSAETDAIDALLEFPTEEPPQSPVRDAPVEPEDPVVPSPRDPMRDRAVPTPRSTRSLIWLTAGVAACGLAVWMETQSSGAPATRGLPAEPARVERSTDTVLAAARIPLPIDRVLPASIAPLPWRRVSFVSQPVVAPRAAAPVSPRPAPKAAETPAGRSASFQGVLIVDSEPTGARVFVNGQPAGTTPLIIPELPAGSRVVRVEASGYAAWSSAVRVVANQETRLRATLHR